MRYAVSGSLLFHVGGASVAVALMSFSPPPEKTQTDFVSVDLVATHSFSTNATRVITSDASLSLSAAGGTPVEAVPPSEPPPAVKIEAAEEPEMLTKTQPVAVRQVAAITPIKVLSAASVLETADIASSDISHSIEPIKVAALTPVTPKTLLASTTQEIPIPLPRMDDRPDRVKEPAKPQKKAKAKPPTKAKKPQQTANRGGNAGQSKANSQASKARAQSAAASNYSGRIHSKLRRSLRALSGRSGGEAYVQFDVASSGAASNIRVARSSGDAKIDAAAIATVRRAAPFPAMPADIGRRSMTFTVPLLFKR